MLKGIELMDWYALVVRSNSEQMVATSLERKGIENFWPSFSSLRRWSDRTKEIRRPLFPGYVFAKFDCQERLPVLTTPAVIDIVGFGQKYVPVSEAELDVIRRVLESRAKCEPAPFLQVGQRVVIENGPLAGVDGLLIEIKQTRRLVVSISLLQRSMNVELKSEWVTSGPLWEVGVGSRLLA
jgi:transcription antitermination factor NusG